MKELRTTPYSSPWSSWTIPTSSQTRSAHYWFTKFGMPECSAALLGTFCGWKMYYRYCRFLKNALLHYKVRKIQAGFRLHSFGTLIIANYSLSTSRAPSLTENPVKLYLAICILCYSNNNMFLYPYQGSDQGPGCQQCSRTFRHSKFGD